VYKHDKHDTLHSAMMTIENSRLKETQFTIKLQYYTKHV